MSAVKKDLKVLAAIRDNTGKIIRLGEFEAVENYLMTEDEITVAIARVQFRSARGGYQFTKRGTTVYQFKNTPHGWILADTMTLWWSTDDFVSTRHHDYQGAE